ncbi:helix-turn-helix domain-containing protein [Hymenobacter elongatus]|uniref:helix-turn-helix domain-containing protein n=1 Tax=Hymenobacter elongatus TaxID=877208 RepID=UPI0014368EBC|nr:transposase [Hymenobacter elongatus]
MKAYSFDLRERVVAACQAGGKQEAVATQFRVSLSFVAKLLRRHRTHGNAAALPPGRGPASRLDGLALDQLSACLRQTPAATLDELRVWLAAVGGPAMSQSALGRAVQALDWRRRKRASTPPSATLNG